MAVADEKKKLAAVQAGVNAQKKTGTEGHAMNPAQTAGSQQMTTMNGSAVDGKINGMQVKPTAGTQNGGTNGISANTAAQLASAQQGYSSPYSGMLNNILQQIQNPKEFNYEFNKDGLFNAYRDLYTQQGRQASLDAQGQAAGLTGGYGNSYGAAVGNQAYQQYLTQLYDKGMDLYDRAWQRYQNDRDQLMQQYNVLNTQDQQGYQQWLNNLNYWTGLGQNEQEQANWWAQFEHQMQQDAQAQANWQAQFDAQQAQQAWENEYAQDLFKYQYLLPYLASQAAASGGGGGGGFGGQQ